MIDPLKVKTCKTCKHMSYNALLQKYDGDYYPISSYTKYCWHPESTDETISGDVVEGFHKTNTYRSCNEMRLELPLSGKNYVPCGFDAILHEKFVLNKKPTVEEKLTIWQRFKRWISS